jgi:pyrroline-5-carboxylate reductase
MVDRDKDFSFLKGEVTSRGGTTEAALAVFDSMNLEVLLEEAVNAATAKSIQLSNLSSNID